MRSPLFVGPSQIDGELLIRLPFNFQNYLCWELTHLLVRVTHPPSPGCRPPRSMALLANMPSATFTDFEDSGAAVVPLEDIGNGVLLAPLEQFRMKGDVPEPSFCLVLGHLSGHSFIVREPAPPAADGEDGTPQDPESRPTQAFDPVALLIERAKQPAATPADALAKQVVILEREELQLLLTEWNGLQDKPLWQALRLRLQKERLARQRLKSNAARRKAIAGFEAAKAAAEAAAEAGGDASAAEAAPPVDDQAQTAEPQVDVLFLLREMPSDLGELSELAAEGLCEGGLVDLWASIYLAGKTVGAEGSSEVDCETPELPRLFYEAIHSAPLGTDMANCTVCTLRDCHSLAFAPPTEVVEGGSAVADTQTQ
ncbi:unnamed protein product [Polarella glacialis]|uniref:Uncharacterized protein n=1 Tax=Polarella glacialis TaxID=89957 RepID=A0A813KXY7_POLGL|nr:unnamed protein product [Polarella glacialis]